MFMQGNQFTFTWKVQYLSIQNDFHTITFILNYLVSLYSVTWYPPILVWVHLGRCTEFRFSSQLKFPNRYHTHWVIIMVCSDLLQFWSLWLFGININKEATVFNLQDMFRHPHVIFSCKWALTVVHLNLQLAHLQLTMTWECQNMFCKLKTVVSLLRVIVTLLSLCPFE